MLTIPFVKPVFGHGTLSLFVSDPFKLCWQFVVHPLVLPCYFLAICCTGLHVVCTTGTGPFKCRDIDAAAVKPVAASQLAVFFQDFLRVLLSTCFNKSCVLIMVSGEKWQQWFLAIVAISAFGFVEDHWMQCLKPARDLVDF